MRGSLFFVQLPICSLNNCCEKLQSFKAKPVFTGLGAANLCATISASQKFSLRDQSCFLAKNDLRFKVATLQKINSVKYYFLTDCWTHIRDMYKR